ncbi:hypothetical protein LLB_2844 [Legionella longbeachae D-4968]|nr:hypothetical protein LLB_2844 [Legionella longbeachae D-4968]
MHTMMLTRNRKQVGSMTSLQKVWQKLQRFVRQHQNPPRW